MAFSTSDLSSLKDTALRAMEGITASEEGMKCLAENREIVVHFFTIVNRGICGQECEAAHICLLNMTASHVGMTALRTFVPNIGQWLILSVQNLEVPYIHMKCQMMGNLTTYEIFRADISNYLQTSSDSFNKLLYLFNSNELEVKNNYHYLAMMFGNISIYAAGRNLFLNRDHPCLKYLLPFTTYGESEIRRFGIAILLKNICFTIDKHKWLLEDIDILPALLLPLAGPDHYSDYEIEKLPLELQYLDNDQMREPKECIRVLLLEALLQLCSTRFGRTCLRDKGVYYVLRNLHVWENSPSVSYVIDSIIEILIRDEEDIGVDNMSTLTIPQDVVDNFQEMVITSPYYC